MRKINTVHALAPYLFIPDETPLPDALQRTTHLAIGAHQDDLEIFAYHGIAACYEQSDLWFGGVTVTDGGGCARAGRFADLSDEQMKALRHAEQNTAAQIGKYGFQAQLAYPSKVVKDPNVAHVVVNQLTEILSSSRPEVLYLHNPMDKHPTHLAVLRCCVEALRRLPVEQLPHTVLGCEVWRSLDWLRDADKIALQVDQHPDLARDLISVFESQIAGGKDYVAAELGRRHANATFFNSHLVDQAQAITFAVDLEPLISDHSMTLHAFAQIHIDRFQNEVRSALHSNS